LPWGTGRSIRHLPSRSLPGNGFSAIGDGISPIR
jgi:hypothetical protein